MYIEERWYLCVEESHFSFVRTAVSQRCLLFVNVVCFSNLTLNERAHFSRIMSSRSTDF